MKLKSSILRSFVPPVVRSIYERMTASYTFTGDYGSWEEAMRDAGGYDQSAILDKVAEAARMVANGGAAFERDSVLFMEPKYEWHIVSALLWAATRHKSSLHVLDFGGSLGSLYFQYKPLLKDIRGLRWSVVEQPAFVDRGRMLFKEKPLQFFASLPEAARARKPDIVIASSVIQYLEHPYAALEALTALGSDLMLIDRTAFNLKGERLTVQKVTEKIYHASYPAWFLDNARFLEIVSRSYDIVQEIPAPERAPIPSRFLGYLLVRK